MELDWLAIVAATVVGMVVAGTWYGKAFTTLWSSLTGVAAADSQKASRRNITQLLVANGMTAVGLTAGIKFTSMAVGNGSVWLALLVGFAAWLAFSASTLIQHNAFELKPPQLTVLNSAYQLVLFLGMALTIGVM